MMIVTDRTTVAFRLAIGSLFVFAVMSGTGCASTGGAKATSTGSSAATSSNAGGSVSTPTTPTVEPDHIQVQHILIGFKGSVRGKPITRTQEEARTLAYSVLERAKAGDAFDDLVKQYTDDQAPGIYGMANNGVAPDATQQEFARNGMVAAFGDVGFKLAVGAIGIADYDPRTSPFGYHVIKRLR